MKPNFIMNCDDCGAEVKAKNSFMLRHSITKKENHVCKECLKKYQMKKSN